MRLRDIFTFSIALLLAGTCTTSCTLLNRGKSKPIITIDDSDVSTEEFLYVYSKNNLNEKPVTLEEIREYLDLFINFKLKVKEAESLGLDQDSVFIQELEGYRKQLASPYLTETKLLDSLALVTYSRLKEEVNASHILIQVAADAEPTDTLAAFNKIIGLRNRVLLGESFAQMAKEYSEDPSAKQNNGNLGYFSAMQMVYPFEEAAYQLSIDSISYPVRTNFGYHIIQLHDRRPSQGKIQISHILVRAVNSLSPADSTLAANRAREIYNRAQNNEDWDLLCRQFSEDIGTKNKGGILPWFKTGDISNIPTFEEAAFALRNIGEISDPVKTGYGWHIIKLNDRQTLEPFDQLEPKIRSNLSANSRKTANQQELVKRLKAENNFVEDKIVIEEVLTHANDSLSTGNWQSDDQWNNQENVLFSIQKTPYKVNDFYRYLEQKQPLLDTGEEPSDLMRTAYAEFSKERLIQFEEAHLIEKYYDYKMLLNEYRDGILLFQLMETKVWNRAVQDTSGLKQYFKDHQNQYQWESRAVAQIFNVADEKSLSEVNQFVDLGYFSYNKFDFYSSEKSFNKAQVKILDNVSQQLIQGKDRKLVMQYDAANPDCQRVYSYILNFADRPGD